MSIEAQHDAAATQHSTSVEVERAAVERAAVEHGRVGPRERSRGEYGEEADRGVDMGAARRSNDTVQHVGRGVDNANSDVEPPAIMACPCTVMVYESCNAHHGYER